MVKGKQFGNYRETGEPRSAIRIYSAQDADELLFLDTNPDIESNSELIKILKVATEECFMPLTAGGGVKSIGDIRALLLAGADKVMINSAAYLKPELIREASNYFGTQCIVVGIDYRTEGSSQYVWVNSGKTKTQLNPVEHAKRLVDLGAGEVIINSIDRDGMMQGYDLEMAEIMALSVNVPVIVSGGAGNFMHIADAFNKTSVSAVACASLFHFGDNNPIRARSYMRNLGIPMRALK